MRTLSRGGRGRAHSLTLLCSQSLRTTPLVHSTANIVIEYTLSDDSPDEPALETALYSRISRRVGHAMQRWWQERDDVIGPLGPGVARAAVGIIHDRLEQ